MNRSLILIFTIFLLVILGCTLPSGTTRESAPETIPTTNTQSDREKEQLKEKIAELEKQQLEDKIKDLEKQVESSDKKASTPSTGTETKTSRIKDGFARVNTPRDGFLALRSAPSTDRGQRLLKIPHGTVIAVYSCTNLTSAGGQRGRWCQTVYEDNPGWVFDAFLTR